MIHLQTQLEAYVLMKILLILYHLWVVGDKEGGRKLHTLVEQLLRRPTEVNIRYGWWLELDSRLRLWWGEMNALVVRSEGLWWGAREIESMTALTGG
jgi:hypothetical protein